MEATSFHATSTTDVEPITWFTFYSHREKREYYYEPISGTTTWVAPSRSDGLISHLPGPPEQSSIGIAFYRQTILPIITRPSIAIFMFLFNLVLLSIWVRYDISRDASMNGPISATLHPPAYRITSENINPDFVSLTFQSDKEMKHEHAAFSAFLEDTSNESADKGSGGGDFPSRSLPPLAFGTKEDYIVARLTEDVHDRSKSGLESPSEESTDLKTDEIATTELNELDSTMEDTASEKIASISRDTQANVDYLSNVHDNHLDDSVSLEDTPLPEEGSQNAVRDDKDDPTSGDTSVDIAVDGNEREPSVDRTNNLLERVILDATTAGVTIDIEMGVSHDVKIRPLEAILNELEPTGKWRGCENSIFKVLVPHCHHPGVFDMNEIE